MSENQEMVSQGMDLVTVQTETEMIESTQYLLKMAEQRSGLIEKVKELSLKATHSGDWMDQSGKPYLMESGATKIRIRFGLRIWDVKMERYRESDKNGEYYYFRYTGRAGFNEREFIIAVGTCSSRDQFFAKRGEEWIPMADVDITNIEKSAYTNFFSNAVTRFLGIRNLTWEELEKFGISKAKVARVEYRNGKKSANWTDEQKKKASRLGNFILATANGDKKIAADSLEKMTAFEDKKTGKVVPGQRSINDLTGKQIDFLFKQEEKHILEFEGSSREESDKEAQDGSAG